MATASPFTTAAKAALARGSSETHQRITIEGRVVGHLIDHALATGHAVSVNDGEETTVHRSSKRSEILGACFTTDEDYLILHRPSDGPTERFGYVYLVYGNSGFDVISDYGSKDLDAFSAWMKPVEDYAEKQELAADAAADSDDEHEGEEA